MTKYNLIEISLFLDISLNKVERYAQIAEASDTIDLLRKCGQHFYALPPEQLEKAFNAYLEQDKKAVVLYDLAIKYLRLSRENRPEITHFPNYKVFSSTLRKLKCKVTDREKDILIKINNLKILNEKEGELHYTSLTLEWEKITDRVKEVIYQFGKKSISSLDLHVSLHPNINAYDEISYCANEKEYKTALKNCRYDIIADLLYRTLTEYNAESLNSIVEISRHLRRIL